MPAMLLFSAQESASSYHNEDSLVSQVVFSLSLSAPKISSDKVIKSLTMTPAPKSVSEPSDPEASMEPLKLSSSSQNPAISNNVNENNTSLLPVNGETVVLPDNGETVVLPVSGDSVILPINGNNTYTNDVSESKMSENIDKNADVTEKVDKSEDEDEISCIIETLAETSLPWRRQTSLPPLPSSVTSSLPDDENPLMSEAPSWADNLAYSHLTESGSPYSSPQNTIKCRPPEASHRPVFELFSQNSTQQDEPAVSSIPPPWSCKHSSEDDEALPSQSVAGSEAGDKASCLLISSHDHVPPSYHSCLQPALSGLESCSSRRHSDVGSPVHFQFMQKPDMISAAAIESELIGIEEDYLHGMADRVSQWLANTTDDNVNEKDFEYVNQEEAERIFESLRQKKKWIMDDTDEGTDADVESDDENYDIQL